MSKYKRLGKNTFLVFIGNMGSKLISFIMLPFYTIWLSVSDYGITDLVSIYVAFLLGVVTFCITDAIFIFPKDQNKKLQSKYFSSGLLFTLSIFVFVAIIFYSIKRYSIVDNTFTTYIWYIYLILISSFFQGFTQQAARSLDKIGVYAISGIVLTSATAILSFLLIPKYGIEGYFIAQILSVTIASIYTLIASSLYCYISIKNMSKHSYLEMLKYSAPLIPNTIMWWLVAALNRPIIEQYLGEHQLGLFAIANKLPSIVSIIFSVFSYSWQISVLEEFKKDGYPQFYNKIVKNIFSLLILISCGMAIFSPYIMSLIVNEKFNDATKYIPLLSLGAVFASFSAMIGVTFSALRKSKYYFYSSIIGATISVILSFILIPKFGLFGACIAVLLSHFSISLSRILYAQKYVKLEDIHKYLYLLIINLLLICSLYWIGYTMIGWFILAILLCFYIIINKEVLLIMYTVLKNKINERSN